MIQPTEQQMTFLLEYCLGVVDWGAIRSATPAGSGQVPDAVRALVSAKSETEATTAYWRLDNEVVVQGQLFEASLPMVPVLLAALAGPLAPPARVRVADLLLEITCGAPDESERALGNTELGRDCRRAARPGLWLIYSLLNDPDDGLRDRAVQIVYAVDDERDRLDAVLAHLAEADPARSVREAATRFRRELPRMIFE